MVSGSTWQGALNSPFLSPEAEKQLLLRPWAPAEGEWLSLALHLWHCPEPALFDAGVRLRGLTPACPTLV